VALKEKAKEIMSISRCQMVKLLPYQALRSLNKAEEGGFWAEVPALPGCYSQGETIEETMENVKEAIEGHLLALKEEREEVPTKEEFVIGRVKVGVSAVV
jgi:predicted RNase H-like HicB family nuclease